MFKIIGRISTVLVILFIFFAAVHPANDDLYNDGILSWSGVKDTFSAVWRVMKGDNNINNFATGYTTIGKEKIKQSADYAEEKIKEKLTSKETKETIKDTIKEEIKKELNTTKITN